MKAKVKKIRLDEVLIRRGLVKDKKEAAGFVFAGEVKVNDETIRSPFALVDEDSEIFIKSSEYVSRGGEKLRGALLDFNIDVRGLVCADIGISTGGFTDCLLKCGASRVYGFDVGYGILDYSLRRDKRVILFERCNFKKFDVSRVKEKVDLIVIDVSFISLKKIVPNAVSLLKKGGSILSLIKPQFEAPKEKVKKGGIVDDIETIESVKRDIEDFFRSLGLTVVGVKPSRIKGSKGNQEFFLLANL